MKNFQVNIFFLFLIFILNGCEGNPCKIKEPALDMTFIYIEPGKFIMGSPEGELGRENNETPHDIYISKGFYIQTTEVTQKQWKAIMGTNPASFQYRSNENNPVENVSWEEVQIFIDKLNLMGTGKYRLPTEAEWEYAARAGSSTGFANGDIIDISNDDPNLEVIGWYLGNAIKEPEIDENADETEEPVDPTSNQGLQVEDEFSGATHPVAKKQPNGFGLYDMHGNVWEWCQDWYDTAYYSYTEPINPKGPVSGTYKIVRGGCWCNFAKLCRSAYRSYYLPVGRSSCIGFRLVREVE
ncbi:MAG: formylglycine-generating enzyme family protein [Desulfobacterales bacterium]|nr:formylglycine-generating enzyme family protein [Desulfobacterales bacterium]